MLRLHCSPPGALTRDDTEKFKSSCDEHGYAPTKVEWPAAALELGGHLTHTAKQSRSSANELKHGTAGLASLGDRKPL